MRQKNRTEQFIFNFFKVNKLWRKIKYLYRNLLQMGRAKQLTKKEKNQIQYLFIRNKSLRFLNKFFFLIFSKYAIFQFHFCFFVVQSREKLREAEPQ